MTPFDLVVLTPREVVFEGKITSLILPTTDGAIGFLAGRERTTVEVLPGDVTFHSGDKAFVLETDGGVAEMTGQTLTLLCGAAYYKEEAEAKKAERSAELDETRARQERSLAEYKINRVALIRAFDKIRRSRIQ